MLNRNNPSLPEPNPITRARHRQQVLWQVFVPMALGVIVVIVLGVLVSVAATAPQIVRLSAISIILMILPTAVVGVLFLGLLVALIYLAARSIQLLPPYARLAQMWLDRVTVMLKKTADTAANPLLTVESKWAGIKAIFQKQGVNGSAASQQTRS